MHMAGVFIQSASNKGNKLKLKNQRIWSSDPDLLKRIADEQENYIGRPFKLELDKGLITIFALPPRRPSKKAKAKQERDKRSEKFEKRA